MNERIRFFMVGTIFGLLVFFVMISLLSMKFPLIKVDNLNLTTNTFVFNDTKVIEFPRIKSRGIDYPEVCFNTEEMERFKKQLTGTDLTW